MSFGHSIQVLVNTSDDALHGKAPWWCRINLSQVCEILNGYPFDSQYFNKTEGVPLIRIRDVTSGKSDTRYSGDFPPGFWIESGDLIVGMDGDFNSRIWRSERGLLNQRVCKLSPNPNYFGLSFLAYVLPGYLKLINEHTHSITVKHLSSKTISDIPLPLPSLPEQHRIAQKLDNLFARTKAARDELAGIPLLIEHYKRAILEKAFTGELTKEWREIPRSSSALDQHKLDSQREHVAHELACRFQSWRLSSDSSRFQIPTTWTWNVLGNLAVHRSGLPFKSSDFGSKGTQVVRLGNLYQGDFDLGRSPVRIDLSDKDYDAFFTRDGDLLVSQTGTKYRKDYGYFVRLPRNSEKLLVNQRVLCISPIDNVYGDYIFHFSGSGFFRDYFFSHETGGVNQGNVGIDGVMTAPIPLPPYEEMHEIVGRIEAAIKWLNVVATENDKASYLLDHLNKAILDKAFRGQLVPQDPNDEPAEKLVEGIRVGGDQQPKVRRSRKANAVL